MVKEVGEKTLNEMQERGREGERRMNEVMNVL